jgi:malonyl-CoA/methylmalonyl-CoA synthetase
VVARLPEATVFMGVPTLYVRLLAEGGFTREACRRMRLFISGSAPLLIETFNEFRDRTGHTILERYGMSETVMLTSNPYRQESRAARRHGRPAAAGCGRAGAHRQGRAAAHRRNRRHRSQGPERLQGLLAHAGEDADEFTTDLWFKTGDVGRIDADGYVTIIGRSKDLVISGGYNVYPAEVEATLNELPGVAESAWWACRTRISAKPSGVLVPRPGAALDERRRHRGGEIAHCQLQGAQARVRAARTAAQRDGQGAEEPAA